LCGTVETPCVVELGPDGLSIALGFAVIGVVLVLVMTICAVRLLTR
jgi:hypothetical protein